MYTALYNQPPEETPSVNYVRRCCIVREVIGETMEAMKLVQAPSRDQLWTDATTRRQIPFTTLIIGLLVDNGGTTIIDPAVVVLSNNFLEDEMLESQADGIEAKVVCCNSRCYCLHPHSVNSYCVVQP
jgi:hypothetical protein